MSTIYIPIAIFCGFFLFFFLFKNKIAAKSMRAYNEAKQKWVEDREGVIQELLFDPNKFGMLQAAAGSDKLEVIVWGRLTGGMLENSLEKGAGLLVGVQSFDMNAYYLAIGGGKLHYFCSNGDAVVEYKVFTLDEMSEAKISYESALEKGVRFVATSSNAVAGKIFKLTFKVGSEEYLFRCSEMLQSYPKFTVEKGYSSGKIGQNPYYRVAEDDDTIFLNLYSTDTLPIFKQAFK